MKPRKYSLLAPAASLLVSAMFHPGDPLSRAQTSRSTADCRYIKATRYTNAELVGCSQAVRDAVKKAFCLSGGGTLNREFGFVVIQTPDGYSTTPVTGFEPGLWRESVPLTAVAIFHTHRNAVSAKPSDQDISEADRIQIPFFVISSRELWIYEPDPNKKGKGRVYEIGSDVASLKDLRARAGN